ncbi:hypothetical protein NDA16_001403 [Ustilago loliicola]|nr:hypothetical protein NDA16_001403 [Ustilago loliicola]
MFTTAPPRSSQKPFQFLTAYAFQGKPRYPEDQPHESDSSSSSASAYEEDGSSPSSSASSDAESSAKKSQIGFPADSEIGRWRDELLRGGEAGEDSLMCTSMSTAGDVAIGVADGVGGWTENGIDPSLFSQALMFYASKSAAAASASPETGAAPNRILAEAFEKVLKEPLVVAGSATACVLTLDSSHGTLRSANLGDSGFVILRQGTGKQGVFHASPPQQLGFNTPLQLAKLPQEWIQEGSISNTPKDAASWKCTLQHGDLIIVGTDGLFDNVDAKIEIPQFAKFIKEKHHARSSSSSSSSSDAGLTSKLPTLPDLRFEQSYLATIRNFLHEEQPPSSSQDESSEFNEKQDLTDEKDEDHHHKIEVTRSNADKKYHELWLGNLRVEWFPILYVTVRDQLLSPLVQGAVWGLGGLLYTQFRQYMSARVKDARMSKGNGVARGSNPSILRSLGLNKR